MATILVLDDRADNRELLAIVLRSAAHDVVEASSGRAALALARDEHPDLIIADMLMPVMDGYEFVRLLRVDPGLAGTRVVFHTGIFTEEEVRGLAAACGVEHFLVKPCEPQMILDVVALALAADESAPPVAGPGVDGVDIHHRARAEGPADRQGRRTRARRQARGPGQRGAARGAARDRRVTHLAGDPAGRRARGAVLHRPPVACPSHQSSARRRQSAGDRR